MAVMGLYSNCIYAQFAVAHDTIRGHVDFLPRLGDFSHAKSIPNDSVFYLFPPDKDIEPWRYLGYFSSSEKIERGYVSMSKLMRVDDFEMIDVERLSSHGTVSFKNENVRVNVSVTSISPSDRSIKRTDSGSYTIHGKAVKGVATNDSPKLRYQSMTVTIKGRAISVPSKLYEYLLEPDITAMEVYYNHKKDIVYIVANNGGTEAYYNALWVVSRKGLTEVYVLDPRINARRILR